MQRLPYTPNHIYWNGTTSDKPTFYEQRMEALQECE